MKNRPEKEVNNHNNNNIKEESQPFPLLALPEDVLANTLSFTSLARLSLLSRGNKKLSSCLDPSIRMRLSRLGVTVPDKNMTAKDYLKFILIELRNATVSINTERKTYDFNDHYKLDFLRQLKAGALKKFADSDLFDILSKMQFVVCYLVCNIDPEDLASLGAAKLKLIEDEFKFADIISRGDISELKRFFLSFTIPEIQRMSLSTLKFVIKNLINNDSTKLTELNAEQKNKFLAILNSSQAALRIPLVRVLLGHKHFIDTCYKWMIEELESEKRITHPLSDEPIANNFRKLLEVLHRADWKIPGLVNLLINILGNENTFERAYFLLSNDKYTSPGYKDLILFAITLPEVSYQAIITEEIMAILSKRISFKNPFFFNFIQHVLQDNAAAYFLSQGAITAKEIALFSDEDINQLGENFKIRDLVDYIAKQRTAQNNNNAITSLPTLSRP